MKKIKKQLCHTSNMNTPTVRINTKSHMKVFSYIENSIMMFDYIILGMINE